MRKSFVLLACAVVLVPVALLAQKQSPKIDSDFVHQQFGDDFTLLTDFPVSVGDLDGDGVEDAVIAARCKNPLIDAGGYNYLVIDPYMTFYGYGDPQTTMAFSKGDPRRSGLVILVIHGAGPDAWRAATPKAKYVIINLPYAQLSVRKLMVSSKHHKQLMAIYIEENSELKETSAVYFDGKHYKYMPMGDNMD